MDIYSVSRHGNADNYLIQGAEISSILTSPVVEQVGAMYNEGNGEFVVDQGLFYPAATDYGYYCTGFETPSEWEDHQNVFGVDGPEIQYAGEQTESLPYVYYTPSYGYAQSPYNPYNPYIPGAMVGVDGPYAGAQQYYTFTPPVTSSGYIPVVLQPEAFPIGSADTGIVLTARPDGKSLKHGVSSASAAFHSNLAKSASNQTNSLNRIHDGVKANGGPCKQSVTHEGVSSGSFLAQASSHVLQGKNASGTMLSNGNLLNGKVQSHHNQLQVTLPVNNSFSRFGSSTYGQTSVDKFQSKIHAGELNDLNGNAEPLGEQNRGPRTNKSKNQLAVKAYTTNVGDSNGQGNIIIHPDQYNKADFSIDYVYAKFLVIKSYSEDDVHKSIKYNVWSSTPHGNKKLQSVYEDAQKVAAGKFRGCPVFLFFSVNASGQFCGVAEMIGPVDFHKCMDFWQHDKWNGSFPVKWHMIKDIPHSSFRHIILENNENKPVTNSRDTQEIMYKQGIEMLKIFKNYPIKTSILDDFLYYESRQKIMQEDKARLMFKSFGSPLLVPKMVPNHDLNDIIQQPPNMDKNMKQSLLNSLKKTETNKDEKIEINKDVKISNQNDRYSWKSNEINKDEKTMNQNDPNRSKNTETSAINQLKSDSNVTISSRDEASGQTTLNRDDNIASTPRIDSLDIKSKQAEPKSAPPNTANKSADIVTIGSMPVKLNGVGESSGSLTVGTILLDPKSLQVNSSGGAFGKQGSKY